MPANALYYITAALYAAVFVLTLRALFAANRGAPWIMGLFLVAAGLHGSLLWLEIFTPHGLNMSLANALSLIVWLAVAIHALSAWRQMNILHPVLAASAAIALLLPLGLPAEKVLPYTDSLAFRLHFLVALGGYGLFTLAALHALLMWFAERYLHEAQMPPLMATLPPLMQMEKLLFTLLWLAFLFLTLTLVTGVFFSETLFGKAFQFNHKTVFAVFSWLIFGGLLAGHLYFGWRGKLAVRWTLIGFLMLLLSYVGSKFVLEVILQRTT